MSANFTELRQNKVGVPELDQWITDHIQGVFGQGEMAVMKEEIEKLEPGEIYLEIGVDEGRSFTTASYYAKDGVWIIGVDYIDPTARHQYMNIQLGHFPNGQSLIQLGATRGYMHVDAKMFASLWTKPISLLFIDGDHSYEGVSMDSLLWEPLVKKGGTILYHDIDHPDVFKFLNDRYPTGWESLVGKLARVRV